MQSRWEGHKRPFGFGESDGVETRDLRSELSLRVTIERPFPGGTRSPVL